MKIVTVCLLCVYLCGCEKNSIVRDPNFRVITSLDTVRFDTVFTSAGSVTQTVQIFNYSKKTLHLDKVYLYGGAHSAYQINLNGASGTQFSNIDIAGGDSMYLFVKVYIQPTAANQPFIVQDSIGLDYNSISDKIQLQAYGQNAHYLRGKTIAHDTTWDNDLPVILLNGLTISNGATLTIRKGSRIYSHANSPLLVNGRLQVLGDTASEDRVVFTNDRLEYTYKNIAGSWPGITFGANSTGNELRYVSILNAAAAIVDTSAINNGNSRIALVGCILNNIAGDGLQLRNSILSATNCQISNCGQALHIESGGNYQFDFCTIASMSNNSVSHVVPSIALSNSSLSNVQAPLTAILRNCIVWGSNINLAELLVSGVNTVTSQVTVDHALFSGNAIASNVTTQNVLYNQDPLFVQVDNLRLLYNFHLLPASPGKSAGIPIVHLDMDMEGKVRNSLNPSLGCYE